MTRIVAGCESFVMVYGVTEGTFSPLTYLDTVIHHPPSPAADALPWAPSA